MGGVINPLSFGHLLVGGTTGSGKSVFINNLLYDIMKYKNIGVVLLDPKGCELIEWAKFPQVMRHSDTVKKCVQTVRECEKIMNKRFKEMKRKGQKNTTKSPIYIFIDEYIDLKTQAGKAIEEPLIRIIAKGRASKVFIILATQRPTRDILSGSIRANFPAVVALRCANAQESRNLIETKGAELLPLVGYGYIRHPNATSPELIRVEPPHTLQEINQLKKSL